MLKFWLMKTEPGECSFADTWNNPGKIVSWWGIRNYQARNFMRDDMQIGDAVLFYHSSCKIPGIVGLARIASTAYPDQLQFDPSSTYFDPKSSLDKPRWLAIDVQAVQPIERITLDVLRSHQELADMKLLARGNRLSITPVTEQQYDFITNHLAHPLDHLTSDHFAD